MENIRLPILDTIFGSRKRLEEPTSLVIVGLGNPGNEYLKTRHNVGFQCVDRLAQEHVVDFTHRNRLSLMGEFLLANHRVVLAKPRTYVNHSGKAVAYLLSRYKVSPQELLIVYDEMSLAPGRLRLRARGSSGGHNGIKSIIETLGTENFPRLRIGIGETTEGTDRVGHVLGTMPKEEEDIVYQSIEDAVRLVSCILRDGIDRAMNLFN